MGPGTPRLRATLRPQAAAPLQLVREQIVTCERCTRLRTYCLRVAHEKRAAYREDTYWGRPVPGFGDAAARLFIVGLAPAAHGANRTGRVFTGDGVGGSGDFLMAALHATGFANLPTSRRADDGLRLHDAFIAAAVRCAPPDNKPTPGEIAACEPHLRHEFAALPNVKVVVALGRIAADAYWRLIAHLGVAPRPRPVFGHGNVFVPDVPAVPALVMSYHPSRQNTNTGRLTAPMMRHVFELARTQIER